MPSFQEHLMSHGFVIMSQWRPGETTLDAARSLGTVIEDAEIPAVQQLQPHLQTESTPNLYSGNFGLDAFPMHTDLAHWSVPPRYLMLRCIRPAPNVRTLVLHRRDALQGLALDAMHRALFRPRRRVRGRLSLLRLLQQTPVGSLLRWDQLFLIPMNKAAIEVADHFRTIDHSAAVTNLSLHEAGDTLLIDNWTVLHARSEVPITGLSRLIERVYLSELV